MQMDSVETNAGTAICCAPSSTARTSGLRIAQIAMGVFDLHRGVVHQDADRQRQAAERHDVDGLPQQAQDDNGGEDRKRNGNADDDRAAPASQKQQNHQAGEPRGDERFPEHALNGRAHEERLIEKSRTFSSGGRPARIFGKRGFHLH